MASRIAGITVEIGGDTTKLTKALKGVDKEIRSTQTALKDVNKLLKLDPKNTELLWQKQKLLKQEIQQTKDRLETLQNTAKNSDLGVAEHDALQREIIETQQKLQGLEKELGNFGSVGKQKTLVVRDEIKNIGEKVKSVGEQISGVGKSLMPMSVAMGGLITAGIKYNAEMETFEANLTTLLGSSDKAKALLSDLEQMASTTPFATSDLISATQTMIGFGISAEDSRKYLEALGNIAMGDAGKLEGLTLAFAQVQSSGKLTGQDLMQMINQGFNPLTFIAEQTGESMAELKERMSKGAVSAEEVAQAFEYATSEGQPFFNAMEAGSKTLSGELSTVTDNFKQMLGELTEALLPIIKQVVEKLIEWIQKFKDLDDGTKKIILIVGLIVAAIGPVLVMIGGVISAIGTIITVVGALISPLGLVVAAIAAVVAIGVLLYKNWDKIKEAAVELKDSVVEKWNNMKEGLAEIGDNIKEYATERWNATKNGIVNAATGARDAIKNKFTEAKNNFQNNLNSMKNTASTIGNSIKNAVSNAFNNAKNAISNAMNNAKSVVSNALDSIRNFFSNCRLELPHIKLPHFSISGSFSLKPPSTPSISVSWYKKAMDTAMTLNSPTLFGMAGGKMLGAGEAGPEVISGESHLVNLIGNVVDSKMGGIESLLATYLPRCAESMKVSDLSDRVEQNLTRNTARRANAW